jgi:hypothetical protein
MTNFEPVFEPVEKGCCLFIVTDDVSGKALWQAGFSLIDLRSAATKALRAALMLPDNEPLGDEFGTTLGLIDAALGHSGRMAYFARAWRLYRDTGDCVVYCHKEEDAAFILNNVDGCRLLRNRAYFEAIRRELTETI